jgi:ankyrin repeat protein
LQQLIAQGWNVNTVDRNMSTALHWAAGSGHVDICKYLMQYAYVSQENENISDSNNPFQSKKFKHSRQCSFDVECGIKCGASLEGFDRSSHVMHEAESVTERKGPSETNIFSSPMLNWARKDGKTPLHWAARNGHIAVVDYFVKDINIDVDVPMKDHSTPLQLAVFGDQLECVQHMVFHLGADLYKVNDHMCDITHWAAMGGSKKVCEWLMKMSLNSLNTSNDSLGIQLLSTSDSYSDVCRKTYNAGIYGKIHVFKSAFLFDHVQREMQTPLHKAAAKKHFDLVVLIVLYLICQSKSACDCDKVTINSIFDSWKLKGLIIPIWLIPFFNVAEFCSIHSTFSFAVNVSQIKDTSGLTALDISIAQSVAHDHDSVKLLMILKNIADKKQPQN